MADIIAMITMPATPTPATDVEPSFPTQTTSIVGPSMLRPLPTIIGQESFNSVKGMLPWVKSNEGLNRPGDCREAPEEFVKLEGEPGFMFNLSLGFYRNMY
ncbi:MAG: hypothetical protein A2Z74_07630 [Chloroflexi bacterium RBG_13_46_9]|nr:MAG: hypothetical protein A2Z74_07630 [Chloroflexi bacterium RBG_13_46_9]